MNHQPPPEHQNIGAETSGGTDAGTDDRSPPSPSPPSPPAGRVLTPQFVLSVPFILLIRAYQIVLGPFMGGHCRFHPTCSEYGLEAYRKHGPIRGTWLTFWRIARCHPFGGSGFDPVP
jgi:uncharacterized protein